MSDETRVCPACDKAQLESDFFWTYDRYSNPWRKVCLGCLDRVQDENLEWEFDPADAGESMEPV